MNKRIRKNGHSKEYVCEQFAYFSRSLVYLNNSDIIELDEIGLDKMKT